MLVALIFATILVSVGTGSWVPLLVVGGIGCLAVGGAITSSGSTLDVRLV
jgi:hypothetical protein